MERLANELLASNGSCAAGRIPNDSEREEMTEKRLKAATSQAVSYRNYRRARDRALVRLAQAYPETYKELLELEKAIDETQGRKWLDINGNTNQLDTRADATAGARTQASNNGENQGNNGGEA